MLTQDPYIYELWPSRYGASIIASLIHTVLLFRPGYDRLCCVRCVQTRDMNYQGSTCICRVPKPDLKKGVVVECVTCGECPTWPSLHIVRREGGFMATCHNLHFCRLLSLDLNRRLRPRKAGLLGRKALAYVFAQPVSFTDQIFPSFPLIRSRFPCPCRVS